MAFDSDIIEAQWKPLDLHGGVGSPVGCGRGSERRVPAGRAASATPWPTGESPSILAERWPALAAAMQRYKQNVAEEFTHEAYRRVAAGIIRFDDRQHLSALARKMDIRPFDAQLLIACAIRQWSVDQTAAVPVPTLLKLRPATRRAWRRLAAMVGLAAALDVVLIWRLIQ